jgi:hypothetical protein
MSLLESLLEVVLQIDSVLSLLALIFAIGLIAFVLVLLNPKGIQGLVKNILGDKMPAKDIAPLIKSAMFCAIFLVAMLLALLFYQMKTESTTGLERPCQGETCWGRDPKDNKCDLDGTTLTSTNTYYPKFGEKYNGQRLEMRYSKLCHASWVKGTVPIGFRAYLKTSSGEEFGNTVKTADSFYTDMGPGEGARKVCVEEPNGSNPQCTNVIDSVE